MKRDPIAFGFLIVCALFTAYFCAQPITWLASCVIIDDALYYLRVPLNVAAGYGLTYDRVTTTNGFHPLWAAVLVPVACAVKQNYMVMLRLAIVLCGLMAIASLVYMRSIGRLLGWSAAGCVAAMAVLFFPRLDLWLSLLESAPSMIVLLVAIHACLKWDLLTASRVRRQLLFGLLMALVFLVRLDQIFIVVAFFVGALVQRLVARQPVRVWVAGLLTSGLFATLLVLPYLMANMYYFGHPVPVSGLKKHVVVESFGALADSFLNPVRAVASKLHVPHVVFFGFLLMLLALGVWAIRWVGRNRDEVPRLATHAVIPWFAVGVLARMVYLRAFVAEEAAVVRWYWVPEYVLACVVFGYVVDALYRVVPTRFRQSRVLRVGGYATCLIVVGAGIGLVHLDTSRSYARSGARITIPTARWARENLSPDARYAMYDSGKFCYFSGFDTISLNGLISDRWTMERSLERDFAAILDRFEVRYLVWWMTDDEVARVPQAALVYRSDSRPAGSVHKGKWLCVIDYSLHNPFQ